MPVNRLDRKPAPEKKGLYWVVLAVAQSDSPLKVLRFTDHIESLQDPKIYPRGAHQFDIETKAYVPAGGVVEGLDGGFYLTADGNILAGPPQFYIQYPNQPEQPYVP